MFLFDMLIFKFFIPPLLEYFFDTSSILLYNTISWFIQLDNMDMSLMTNAEKQKRYRQRLVEKYGADTIKNKDKAWKKQKQEENLAASREKERIRQEKYRASKAGKISNSTTFKSKTTLTKAVKQASEALPKSPRKRSMVAQKLLNQHGIICRTFVWNR